jgi:ABC-type xylose transport system permease subunit
MINMFVHYRSEDLSARGFLVFQRLQRFYKTFALLNGFISVAGATALSMEEFHPTSSSLAAISEGLLCSSIITAVTSAVICIMLLFRFEGAEKATQGELLLAWSPLILLDISVMEFLVGLVCWYLDRNASWRGLLLGIQFVALVAFCIGISFSMWSSFNAKNGLGKEEREAVSEKRADHSTEGHNMGQGVVL